VRQPLWIIAALSAVVTAQQSPTPRFEVASVKLWHLPTTPVTGTVVGAPAGSGVFNRATTVAGLITYAYEVQDFQVNGGEEWVRTERYDVAARAGREVSPAELRAMVKALLEERFKLRVRIDTREMSILELRLARSDGRAGPNLHDCASEKVPEEPFRAPRGGTVSVSDCANGVAILADIASRQLQTLVLDKTDLKGQWWFNVYYNAPPRLPGVVEQANPDLPSFEGALREQLGLKLERTRGPVPLIVIDHIERPTEN
jgi:uncharacterized protein (TIGR03435 family)